MLKTSSTYAIYISLPAETQYRQGQDRTQTHIFTVSLDVSIGADNEDRLIDLFVDSLQLKDFGFRVNFPENSRPY